MFKSAVLFSFLLLTFCADAQKVTIATSKCGCADLEPRKFIYAEYWNGSHETQTLASEETDDYLVIKWFADVVETPNGSFKAKIIISADEAKATIYANGFKYVVFYDADNNYDFHTVQKLF